MDNGRLRKSSLNCVTEDGKLDIIVLPDRLHDLWAKYIYNLPIHISHYLDFTTMVVESIFVCAMPLWESMWPVMRVEREI